MGSFVRQVAELLIDFFEQAFDKRLQFEGLVVAEHEGVEVGHLEVNLFEVHLSTVQGELASENAVPDFLDGGLSGVEEVGGADVEEGHPGASITNI